MPMMEEMNGMPMEESEDSDPMEAALNLIRRALAQDLMRAITRPKAQTTPEMEVPDESSNGNG